jgi:hypothetical protein
MKIIILVFIFGLLVAQMSSAKSFNPGQRKSGDFNARNNNNKNDKNVLDTVFLSWSGDFGLSRTMNGSRKIIEGLVTCKSLLVAVPKIYRAGA